jgi:hypothetical protein
MDSVLRGWVIGYLLGHALSRHRDAQRRWAAVAYSDITGMAWSWNHRSARAAKHAALAHCQGPQPRLWACATNITIAVARGPRGAFARHWADPRLATHAGTDALTRRQATYPTTSTATRSGSPWSSTAATACCTSTHPRQVDPAPVLSNGD